MDKDSLNNAINRIVAALKDHDINVSAEEVPRKMYGLRGYFSAQRFKHINSKLETWWCWD